VARVLIVGGGCRGRHLAADLVHGGGHAVRIVTRTEAGRAEIEASGAECLIGTPDRLASLRGALDGVTIACWLLATARGDETRVRSLHGSRLEAFLGQAIDTTMRGFVYEAPDIGAGMGASMAVNAARAEGEHIVRTLTSRNAIPAAFVRADPSDVDAWLADAIGAVDSLLDRGSLRPAACGPLS
jgi:hypothetical protein